jgi:hypothetical protein
MSINWLNPEIPMTQFVEPNEDGDRREFLKTCGRFAAVTPPAMTLLLSTSLTSEAIAQSGGKGHKPPHNGNNGNNGKGKGKGRE